MPRRELVPDLDLAGEGTAIYELIERLYPICRSITGDGVRESLGILSGVVPLEINEVPTGTPVLDWTVPREWNVREAWVAGPDGQRVIDFKRSNLHLVSYSTPVRTRLPLAELREHLHTDPERPAWIPYRTSYYTERWGLCLPHEELLALPEGEYEVCVDTTLEDGHLTYGELVLPGESRDEVLVHTHVCHPSMCNDNLSGMSVATRLAAALARVPHRLTYRFLFVPGLIGSITWLARNEDRLDAVRAGLVISNMGDPGALTYKRSRRGDATVDRAAAHVVGHRAGSVVDFSPFGYDERQYCSPGFNLPVGSLSRSSHGEFAEYHSSADDLELVRPAHLADSMAACLEIFGVLEGDAAYRNTSPKGEPQLGRRGLYRTMGGDTGTPNRELALLWVLNFSDTHHSLLDIAERAGLPFASLRAAADDLLDVGLLEPVS